MFQKKKELWEIRLQKEWELVLKQKKLNKFPENVISMEPEQIEISLENENLKIQETNLKKWILTIQGRKDSVYDNQIITVFLEFSSEYPKIPPKVKFEEDFKHIHVYENGFICLDFFSEDFWDFRTNMIQIVQKIELFIHSVPNLKSPANLELAEIYYSDFERYKEIVKRNNIIQQNDQA